MSVPANLTEPQEENLCVSSASQDLADVFADDPPTLVCKCDNQDTLQLLSEATFVQQLKEIATKPRKGKKIPPDTVRAKLRAKQACVIVLDGPRGIGKSSCLQALT